MSKVNFYFLFTLFLFSCNNEILDHIDFKNPVINEVLSDWKKYNTQIILTEISRNSDGKISFKDYNLSCKNAISMQSKFAYRVMKAKWIDSLNHEYSSTIEILGIDNHGLLNTITKIISENLNLNMKKSVFTTEGDTFKGEITLTVKHKRILNELIDKLKKIPGVDKVVRF